MIALCDSVVRPAMTRRFTVAADADGSRLDRFLASVVGDRSRSQIQRLIKDGLVNVAGRPAKPNQPVRSGQEIAVEIPEAVEAAPRPEPLPLPILYQDRDIIV